MILCVNKSKGSEIILYPKYFLLNLLGLRIFDPFILITWAEGLAYTIVWNDNAYTLHFIPNSIFKTVFVVEKVFYILKAPF